MEIGHCKTCKHWGAGRVPIIGFDPRGQKHCDRFSYETARPNSDSARLESGDYASSNGSLWTAPEFGCVLWEERST